MDYIGPGLPYPLDQTPLSNRPPLNSSRSRSLQYKTVYCSYTPNRVYLAPLGGPSALATPVTPTYCLGVMEFSHPWFSELKLLVAGASYRADSLASQPPWFTARMYYITAREEGVWSNSVCGLVSTCPGISWTRKWIWLLWGVVLFIFADGATTFADSARPNRLRSLTRLLRVRWCNTSVLWIKEAGWRDYRADTVSNVMVILICAFTLAVKAQWEGSLPCCHALSWRQSSK